MGKNKLSRKLHYSQKQRLPLSAKSPLQLFSSGVIQPLLEYFQGQEAHYQKRQCMNSFKNSVNNVLGIVPSTKCWNIVGLFLKVFFKKNNNNMHQSFFIRKTIQVQYRKLNLQNIQSMLYAVFLPKMFTMNLMMTTKSENYSNWPRLDQNKQTKTHGGLFLFKAY